MNETVSSNAQAILLLTAPLIAGRTEPSLDLLTPGEYNRLARALADRGREPADLLGADAAEIIADCATVASSASLDRSPARSISSTSSTPSTSSPPGRAAPPSPARLERLLSRGFLLSQAIERWQARAIWVVGRSDAHYPARLKERLADRAPAVLYGCGDAAILDTGGLAVVGSRDVNESLVAYTQAIGRLAAAARCTLVSGGARGIDQASMRGALEEGGKVAGVLSDSLERAALAREHREVLMDGRLALVSPYDPLAGFNAGQAMQRNKYIYALADAALVVNSDYQKGGTWTGAVEQLDKFRFVPIYIRSTAGEGLPGETGEGLAALRRKGALPWPNPTTPEALIETLSAPMPPRRAETMVQEGLPFDAPAESAPSAGSDSSKRSTPSTLSTPSHSSSTEDRSPFTHGCSPLSPVPLAAPAFLKARDTLLRLSTPQTESQVAEILGVSKSQTRKYLRRLVEEGVLEKLPTRPIQYRSTAAFGPLFDPRD